MVAEVTMPVMTKQGEGKSVPVSFRLKEAEAKQLDDAAAAQSVPVNRATMVEFIVRKWLRENPAKPKK